jgi:nitroreductase
MIEDLILKNRSYRRFDENVDISRKDLEYCVNLARISPSARNAQPLKYFISNDSPTNQKIFEQLAWAGYLKDWDGPKVGERPSAYIIILLDKSVTENFRWDDGIVAQSMLLGAVEKGFGGCMIGSIKKKELTQSLNLPDNFEIQLVIALGKPIEEIVLDDVKENDIKYWRDKDQVHHVPKRQLKDLIIN